MNSKSGFSKTQATSAAALALALFCAKTYIPEIAEKLRTDKIEPPAWAPDLPVPELPTQGIERVSPQGSCADVSYSLEVTASGGVATNGGTMLSNKDCVETTGVYPSTHSKDSDNELARELLEKHRNRGRVANDQHHPPKDEKVPRYADKEESVVARNSKESDMARMELLELARQSRNATESSRKISTPSAGLAAICIGMFALVGAVIFCQDVKEEIHQMSGSETQLVRLSQESKSVADTNSEQTENHDLAARDPQQFVECFALEGEELPESAELTDSYDADWASIEPQPDWKAQSRAIWPCTPFHLSGIARSAIIVIALLSFAFVTSRVRGAMVSTIQQRDVAESVNHELLALSAKHQKSTLSNGVTVVILSIITVLGAVVFSFDIHDQQKEEEKEEEATNAEPCVDETSTAVTPEEGDPQKSDIQPHALWPCTPFHLQGLLRSAILVLGVVVVALATSQVRGAMAPASEQQNIQVQSGDEELMLLSAKHQNPQSWNGVTMVILSTLAALGAGVFCFDIHDAQEEMEEFVEPCVDKPSQEVTTVESNQKPQGQSPALWPCTPFHLQGFARSAVFVACVVGFAVVTSQVRGAMSSASDQHNVQVVHAELMALSAKYQKSRSSDGVTAVVLSIFAALGALMFSFDIRDDSEDQEEDEVAVPDVHEPSQEVTKAKSDEEKPEAQPPALWPCTPFHLQGLLRSAVVVIGVVGFVIVTSQIRGAMASASDQPNAQAQSADVELIVLSAKYQHSQSSNGVTAAVLSIFAALGAVMFSFDIRDAQEAEEVAEPCVDEPSQEVTKVESGEQEPEVQLRALWPCTPFHLQGLLRSAILAIGVVAFAIMTSQVRGAMASPGEQHSTQAQSIDDELMALSAKHQTPQSFNGVTAVVLSIFAALGVIAFSFDIHDAQEEHEVAEPCVDEPSQEVPRDEQKPEAQLPALWPCTPFHLQGLLRSATLVVGVVAFAIVTSQVREAMASAGEQHSTEVQSVDDELMALSAKNQTPQSFNGVTAVVLSIFVALCAVAFSFDIHDAQEEEDEVGEPCVDEPSQEVQSDEQKPEAQLPALWPCTPFHLQGLLRSAILVVAVVGFAIVASQVRGAMASAGEQRSTQAQSIDDELMALSAKHQNPQSCNDVTAVVLSILAALGAVAFIWDIHDAQEEADEIAKPCVDEPSQEATKVESEQKLEAQPPTLWPCAPFHLQGLLRSAIVVIGVVGLAIVISQVRAAMASAGEQQNSQAQSVDAELVTLSAKHQNSQSWNGVTAAVLSIFAGLGAVVFSFDIHDAQEEEHEQHEERAVKDSSLNEASKQFEVQSPALPCLAL